MKKLLFIFPAMLLLVFVSCQKNEDSLPEPKDNKENSYLKGSFEDKKIEYSNSHGQGRGFGKRGTDFFFTNAHFALRPNGEKDESIRIAHLFSEKPAYKTSGGTDAPAVYELKPGKYAWGRFGVSISEDTKPYREGVAVEYIYPDEQSSWSSTSFDMSEQPEDSYFEITKVEAHESDPNLIWVEGKFTCQMHSLTYKHLKVKKTFKDVAFRAVMNKPQFVYDTYFK